MKTNILKITALFALGVAMTACQRESVEESDNLGTPDIAASQAMMDDADDQASFKSDPTTSLGDQGTIGGVSCPTLTWANTQGTFPNTLTIDYGTSCACVDGRTKSGQIIVEMTDELRTAGAIRTITLQDFYVNGTHLEGTRVVTNITGEGAVEPQFTVVSNGTATFTDGNTAQMSMNHVRTMIAGYDTDELNDDVFSVTGSQSGTGRRGRSFTGQIIQPLIRSLDCRWITQGVIEMTSSGRTHTLDFGNGTCDDQAELTLANGTTKTITLRRH